MANIDFSLHELLGNWKGQLATGMSFLSVLGDSDNRVEDRGRAWCQSMDVPYFRFTPPLREPIGLPEADTEKLINMMWDTMAYCHERRNEFEMLAEILKR